MRHGFSRFALVGIIATRIGRITQIYADFPDVELTYFFHPKNEHYLIRVNSKIGKIRVNLHYQSDPRCHYSYEARSAKIRVTSV